MASSDVFSEEVEIQSDLQEVEIETLPVHGDEEEDDHHIPVVHSHHHHHVGVGEETIVETSVPGHHFMDASGGVLGGVQACSEVVVGGDAEDSSGPSLSLLSFSSIALVISPFGLR